MAASGDTGGSRLFRISCVGGAGLLELEQRVPQPVRFDRSRFERSKANDETIGNMVSEGFDAQWIGKIRAFFSGCWRVNAGSFLCFRELGRIKKKG